MHQQLPTAQVVLRPDPGAMSHAADDRHKILLVDDDVELLGELAEAFSNSGMMCRISENWSDTLSLLEQWQPDIILLDQRLKSVDTLLLLPVLRQHSNAAVLFFTGNRSEADRVIGLELGADDFLLKPISTRELVARVRAHMRRSKPSGSVQPRKWHIVTAERKVVRPDGSTVPLTSTEFELFYVLAANPGVAVERDQLSRHVLRRPFVAEDRALDNLVHQIRHKFGTGGVVINSVRNIGYAFCGFPAE